MPADLDAIRARIARSWAVFGALSPEQRDAADLLAEVEALRITRDELWTRIDAMQAQTDLDGCLIDQLIAKVDLLERVVRTERAAIVRHLRTRTPTLHNAAAEIERGDHHVHE